MKDRHELIESASRLPAPEGSTSAADMNFGMNLASQLDSLMLAEPDIDAMVPLEQRSLMRTNHRNHMKYMNSVAELFNPTTFVDTIIWAMKTYRSHGFAPRYWERMLPHCISLMMRTRTSENRHLIEYYQWILDNLDSLVALSDPRGQEGAG